MDGKENKVVWNVEDDDLQFRPGISASKPEPGG